MLNAYVTVILYVIIFGILFLLPLLTHSLLRLTS